MAGCASTVTTQSAVDVVRPDFKAALEAHLATIADRDIDAYADTITKAGDLYVIFPDGSATTTTEGVIDFHEDWFADEKWSWEIETVKIIEGADMAMAVLKHHYRDNADVEPRSSWLVMVFQIEDGEWRLVHDQNTRIVPQGNE